MDKQKLIATLRECLEATWLHKAIIFQNDAAAYLTDVAEGMEITANKLKAVIAELEASDGR